MNECLMQKKLQVVHKFASEEYKIYNTTYVMVSERWMDFTEKV